MIQVIGRWINEIIRERTEMLHQNDSAYLFDSTKIEKAFSFRATTYSRGIYKLYDH